LYFKSNKNLCNFLFFLNLDFEDNPGKEINIDQNLIEDDVDYEDN